MERGALMVRDGEALRAAHEASAGYLPPLPDPDFYNAVQYGPELSRDFRGLRVWLPIKLFGATRFRAALSEKRALALRCAEAVAKVPGVKLCHAPQLSLFAFVVNRGNGLEEQNRDTRAVLRRVTEKGRVMLTGAQVGDTYYGRVCVLCFRTRAAHIEMCIDDITEAVQSLD